MKPLIQSKQARPTVAGPAFCILLALGFSLLCPVAQAVVPSPDGGYPNFNTAEGQNALFNLTSGSSNTAVGWFSLFSNTDGSFNTAVGAGTLLFNVGNQSTGDGTRNTAIGTAALLQNIEGSQNTAVGVSGLSNNTEGELNTAIGASALFGNTAGSQNTATGARALFNNSTGLQNTANGTFALERNTEGTDNSAMGLSALFSNTIGNSNTATGAVALGSNTEGSQNTAIGSQALLNNTTGVGNTALGSGALLSNNAGNDNIAIGHNALPNNGNGSANIALGLDAGANVNTASNVICIGAIGANEGNSCFIGNIFDQTSAGGAAVFVNAQGKLGTTTSSRRFKDGIKPMENASNALFALKPVTFHYKADTEGIAQFGLIAEEVAEVNPELVVRDKEGNPYTVRYDAVNAMLLNEFLKEHKKVEEQAREIREQKAAIDRLGKTVGTVIARIEEHDLKIRRVNEQNEMSQIATRRIRPAGPMLHIVRND